MKIHTQNKKKKKGFTLIEVIAVLVLLGILAAIALPQYLDLTDEAEGRAIDAGVAELNSREALAWGQAKLLGTDIATDGITIDTNLGSDYTLSGSDLTFGGTTATLSSTTASETAPAVWSR